MKVLTLFLISVFGIFVSSASRADDINALVGETCAKLLLTEGSITQVSFRKTEFSLLPKGTGDLKNQVLEVKPSFLVESAFLYRKPAFQKAENKEVDDKAWTEAQHLALFNALCSLSSLEGIEYFSASRQRMRVFYEYSYAVPDAKSDTAIPDPVFSELPESTEIHAIQKDLSFGKNRYIYRFTSEASSIRFVQKNINTMFYGIFPLIGAEKLRTAVYIADAGEYLLLYAVSGGDTLLLPGLDGKIRDSFSNRAAAIYKWFAAKADAIF